MPDMDGFDASAQIRAFEATPEGGGGARRVPIVALTANAMTGDRERCIAAGTIPPASTPRFGRLLAGGAHRVIGLVEQQCAARFLLLIGQLTFAPLLE